jgi:hypothetical protein
MVKRAWTRERYDIESNRLEEFHPAVAEKPRKGAIEDLLVPDDGSFGV